MYICTKGSNMKKQCFVGAVRLWVIFILLKNFVNSINEIFVKYCILGRDKNNQLTCKNVYLNMLQSRGRM